MCRYIILLGSPSLYLSLLICVWHRDNKPLRQEHEMSRDT